MNVRAYLAIAVVAFLAIACGIPSASQHPERTPAEKVTRGGDTAPIPVVSGDHLDDAAGKVLSLHGVDAPGTEENCAEGWGFSSGSLSISEAEGIASWHANAVRVPLNEDCWLGINRAPPNSPGRIISR